MVEKYIVVIFWLTINAYHESRGEPDDGVIAVCKVVLNRTVQKRWPDTVKEVIFQPYQFSWTADKALYPLRNYKELLRCTKLAVKAHFEWRFGKRLKRANHYHADYVTPGWIFGMTVIKKIGKHIFYRDG